MEEVSHGLSARHLVESWAVQSSGQEKTFTSAIAKEPLVSWGVARLTAFLGHPECSWHTRHFPLAPFPNAYPCLFQALQLVSLY